METIRWNWQLHWLLAAAGPKHLLEATASLHDCVECSMPPAVAVLHHHGLTGCWRRRAPGATGWWGPTSAVPHNYRIQKAAYISSIPAIAGGQAGWQRRLQPPPAGGARLMLLVGGAAT